MTIQELSILDLYGKNIVIIGYPGHGKTYVYNKIYNNKTHYGINTDSFMSFGFEQSLYEIFNSLEHYYQYGKLPYIIEGVQGYRFLRKSMELDKFKPDIVIQVQASKKRQVDVYSKERDPKKLKSMKSFEMGLEKTLNDYLLKKEESVQFITFNNEY
jgi:adenylate kinase family enzyme